MLPSTGNQPRKVLGMLLAIAVLIALPTLAGVSLYLAFYGNSGGSVGLSDAEVANLSIYKQCLGITGKLERRAGQLEMHNAAAASMAWLQAAMVSDAGARQLRGTGLHGFLEERSRYELGAAARWSRDAGPGFSAAFNRLIVSWKAVKQGRIPAAK